MSDYLKQRFRNHKDLFRPLTIDFRNLPNHLVHIVQPLKVRSEVFPLVCVGIKAPIKRTGGTQILVAIPKSHPKHNGLCQDVF